MNYLTSTANPAQSFRSALEASGGLNGGGDTATMEALERLFNFNNSGGGGNSNNSNNNSNNITHQQLQQLQQGQQDNQYVFPNTNSALEASILAAGAAANNNGETGFDTVANSAFNIVNEDLYSSADQQQGNLLSQLLMNQANGNNSNSSINNNTNDNFGFSQLGGGNLQANNNNHNNNNNNNNSATTSLLWNQPGFLNGASNTATTGGMSQTLLGHPSNPQAQVNANATNLMLNAQQQAQQLFLLGQYSGEQQHQQQHQSTALPHQQLMSLLAGINNSQNGGNAFIQGNMAPTTSTLQQLMLQQQLQQQQQQHHQSGNPLLSGLDFNHPTGGGGGGSSYHDLLNSNSASARDALQHHHVGVVVTAKTSSPAMPAVQAPLRALSAYNFFFRYQRERILNGQDVENSSDTDPDDNNNNNHSDDHDWDAERQESLLQAHWGRDRTVKRRHRKSHGKISFADLSKKISHSWKCLPEHRKDFFREVASKDWARYHRELTQHKLDLTTAAGQMASAAMGGGM